MTLDGPDLPAFDHDVLDTCNLVMKGGITSGVVYPGAIRVLATRYRFRKIGGTSAGAIAAAFTAAAEYSRRAALQAKVLQQPHQSFEGIWTLGQRLQEHLPDGRTRLESLFAPNVRTQPLSDLLGTALHPKGALTRGFRALMGISPAPTLTAALGGGLVALSGVRTVGWGLGVTSVPSGRGPSSLPAFQDAPF